ncbi:hypothetical protein DV738_g5210, partial [Chaetothyriales sp. CBS 135597]
MEVDIGIASKTTLNIASNNNTSLAIALSHQLLDAGKAVMLGLYNQGHPLPSVQRAALCLSSELQHSALSETADLPPIPQSGIYTVVQVISASLNPVDYKLLRLPWPITRLVIGSHPTIPGVDFVGRVWQTTHPDLQAGDLCWGKLSMPTKYGTCAEFTLHTGKNGIAKVPEGFGRSLDELAGVGIAGLTALNVLKQCNLPFNRTRGKESGGKLFVNGASGGTGTFTVQMAKAMGVQTVVASCSGANADLVKSLGADEVIDYRSQNVVEALRIWSKRGRGQQFDAIIDNVGSDPAIYYHSEEYLKASNGVYLAVGVDASWSGLIETAKILMLPTLLGGGTRPYGIFMLFGTEKEDWELIGKWMVEGKVRTVIEDDNRFALSDIQSAVRKLQTGRTRGKIIITVAEHAQ